MVFKSFDLNIADAASTSRSKTVSVFSARAYSSVPAAGQGTIQVGPIELGSQATALQRVAIALFGASDRPYRRSSTPIVL